VNANGSVVISNPTVSGVFTFSYRIQNTSGFSDALVTVTIQAP
jgi:surface antigen